MEKLQTFARMFTTADPLSEFPVEINKCLGNYPVKCQSSQHSGWVIGWLAVWMTHVFPVIQCIHKSCLFLQSTPSEEVCQIYPSSISAQ